MDDSMITLQDVLFEGENVLWQGKPNKFCYVMQTAKKFFMPALAFLLFDSFFIIIMKASMQGEMPKGVIFFMVGFFAFHLLPVWLFVGNVLKSIAMHKNVIYAITDKRVIMRQGVIGLDFDNLNYSDISNISVDVSVIDKIKNVGSVIIKTSSGQFIYLSSIEKPYEVYKLLNKTFIDMNADIQFPNAYRPADNPGYNTKYSGQ